MQYFNQKNDNAMKQHRIKTITALLAVLAFSVTARAQAGYDFQAVTPAGDTLLCTITDSAAHLVSVRGDEWSYNTHYIHYSPDLVLPGSVEHGGESYAVAEVEAEAFRNHTEIETVTVPDGITAIGSRAFSLVPNVIYHGPATGSPWGALTVNGYEEDSLFYLDSSKTRLTGGRNIATAAVPQSVSVIGRNAFYYKSTLRSVVLPEGLDTIGRQAFGMCNNLGSTTIPSSVRSIGQYAFYGAFRPDATVTIADAPASIGAAAFYYSNMRHIDLGNSITRIGNDAFNSCNSLDTVVVPNSVSYIGSYAFCYNYTGSLKKVVLPEGLDTIRVQTFFGCTGLEEVNIPSSVVYIDTAAFHECWELGPLTLPAGLTGVADYAFFQCHSIDTLRVLAEVPPAVGEDAFLQMSASTVLVVPCGTEQTYGSASGWQDFAVIIADCNDAVDDVEAPGAKIYSDGGQIVVEGAGQNVVTLSDIGGRILATRQGQGAPLRFDVPATGTYLVKVGCHAARKVVAVK